MTRRRGPTAATALIAAGLIASSAQTVPAQTREQIETEPIVKQQPGDTPVPGQCLSREELDLIAALNALRRPTVGVEGTEDGDDPQPFDPHYFVGTWRFEGVVPESPLGEAGEFVGTETVRHVDGCSYESAIAGTIAGTPIAIATRMVYDRRSHYLVRIEDDSRGFELLKMGRVGGDPGGFFSHHWNTPAITAGGSTVRLQGRTYITSPFAYRLQTRISVDGGPFVNLGTIWWDRAEEP